MMEERSKATINSPGWLNAVIGYLGERMHGRQRKLKLCESLSLGDKRVLAVVEVEQERFLVASTPTAITLLTRLPNSDGENASASVGVIGAACAH